MAARGDQLRPVHERGQQGQEGEQRRLGPNDSFDPGDPALVPPDAEPDDGEADEESNEKDCDGEGDEQEDCPGPRYEWSLAWTPPHPGTDVAAPETDWATRPQVLALGSHFRRLGIGPADQTALLRARFGKFRPERLTRDEAAGLMRHLERGEWVPAGNSATAN